MTVVSTHQSVLLTEAIEGLAIQPDGIYVDGTYGRGGHSDAILQQLSTHGKLLAFDQDPEAVTYALQRHGNDPRFRIEHASFTALQTVLAAVELVGKVDGILLDLGVSSPQLDEANRGFSFMQEGPLDMRMDNSQGLTVAEWLTQTDEQQLADVFYQYGEERFSRRIAHAVMQAQQEQPITTTKALAEIISKANPKWEKNKHPATRCFQALRIFINNELTQLQQVLQQCLQVLKTGGRLAVISFHSLEDRMVKQFMQPQQAPKNLPLTTAELAKFATGFKAVGKAVKASPAEINDNPRSRSATLRIAEKLA